MLKQVIVVRKDVRMGKGKTAVQVAHASVTTVLEAIREGGRNKEWIWKWYSQGQKKVVVKAEGPGELIRIYNEAKRMGYPSSIVYDAGKTQLEPGTLTAVAVGPAPEKDVDRLTGHLKLL